MAMINEANEHAHSANEETEYAIPSPGVAAFSSLTTVTVLAIPRAIERASSDHNA
jgi:hypothetical protein